MSNNICIIGLGYVGLPLACLAASRGYRVCGFDIDEDIVSKINSCKIESKDPIVGNFFQNKSEENFFFATNEISKIQKSDIYIFCVPTPINENLEPDFGPLFDALNVISQLIKKNDLIIIESTVFPGTCDDILIPLIEDLTKLKCKSDFDVSHCPERINPGDTFWTSDKIPRVIGSSSLFGLDRTAVFYSSILGGDIIDIKDVKNKLTPKFKLNLDQSLSTSYIPLGSVIKMKSLKDAEAVKSMENTVRDVNISFVNELAKISEVLNLDLIDIIDGMATKPFGKGPFYPGVGVGGHCIAVDPEWLKSASIKAGHYPQMIELSRNTNKSMPKFTINLLFKHLKMIELPPHQAVILLLGVTYKRNIKDDRESPFYDFVKIFEKEKIKYEVFDSLYKTKNTVKNIEEGISKADALIIITDHQDFINYFNNDFISNSKLKVIIDGRNCLNANKIKSQGILYTGIGRR